MPPSACGVVCASVLLLALAGAATVPTVGIRHPTVFVQTSNGEPAGRTLAVPRGGDVQAALDAAQPGDVITLEPGTTYRGPLTLPRKSGSGWIVIRSGAPDASLPPPGTRADPSHAHAMPKLEAATGSVFKAAPGAHHYRLVGLEMRPAAGVFLYNLVELGSTEMSAEGLPRHIIVDRCYLHGDPRRGTRRGVALQGAHMAVIDSYVADFKEVGADSQALAGWAGPGPFKIVNNYLEGAGENVMFGGGDPSIRDLVPSDIEIRRNHFAKPLAWKQGEPTFAGTAWSVKNLFELKNARRVLVDGNVFEHNWVQAQNGFAVLFTVRNQDGRAPWSVVEDVMFTNNVVRGTASGINILGQDDNHPSQTAKRIVIKNNLFLDVGAARWGGGGRFLQLLNATASIVVDHNTAFHTGNIISADGPPHRGFVFTHNIVSHNAYGIAGSGVGIGNQALEALFPGAVVRKNVIVGGSAGLYPKDNFVTSSLSGIKFENLALGRVRLTDSSPYRRAGLDGADLGVDFSALPEPFRAALAGQR